MHTPAHEIANLINFNDAASFLSARTGRMWRFMLGETDAKDPNAYFVSFFAEMREGQKNADCCGARITHDPESDTFAVLSFEIIGGRFRSDLDEPLRAEHLRCLEVMAMWVARP